MRTYFEKKSGSFLVFLAALLATALLWGCGGGSDSYDTPTAASNAPIAGAATNVLIEPATLASWIGQGLVNNQSNFDQNVVVLDFASATDAKLIRGAQRVPQGDLQLKRLEGIGDANPMVATGAQMDAVIQRLGIKEDTVIVFTTSGNPYLATRAYWTFRYWGFPKERLRFVNGGNAAFEAAYPELMTTEAPSVTSSTYSVRNLTGINDDLRASVGEMIGIVSTLSSSTANLVLDARGVDPAKGKCGYYGTSVTPGQITTGSVVVFDGHPEGAQYLNQGDLFTSGKFKSADEIKALFAAKGWAPGKRVTVYCTTGYSATPLFFALDTILDTPAQLFDGSWSVLGKYSQNASAGGQLPVGSPWAVDKYLDPVTLKYNNNVSAGLKIEPLHGVLETPPMPFIGDEVNPEANQIEAADLAAVGSTPSITITEPVATATSGVLITPGILQSWMDAGLVNAPAGAERVVILDVTALASYAAGHIPGAQLWDTAGQAVTRVEGPAEAVNMVIPAAKMNERIQALGIDENTTIVLTSSQTSSFMPSRAYFTFRYYGWPKSRLKVLNGYTFAWEKSALTTTATDLADSTLTVQQIGNLRTDLRASLPELMDGIRDGRGIPVDFRGSSVAAAGSTAGVFNDDHDADGTASQAGGDADYVVFEGTMKGAKYYTYTNFQMDPANGDYRFKPELIIRNELGAMGLTGSELMYSMCRTGYIASTGFFVLDGILGWPVMIYDGSWSQWGSLSDKADKGGQLTAGSPWAVDNATYMAVTNYNKSALKKVEPLNPDSAALLLKPSDAAANQIEKADAEYQAVPPASTGGTSGPPTAGGGSAGGGC